MAKRKQNKKSGFEVMKSKRKLHFALLFMRETHKDLEELIKILGDKRTKSVIEKKTIKLIEQSLSALANNIRIGNNFITADDNAELEKLQRQINEQSTRTCCGETKDGKKFKAVKMDDLPDEIKEFFTDMIDKDSK